MKVLWFTWKDLSHPLAGGAEVVNQELAKRLVDDGHEVTFIVGGYKDGEAKEKHKDGYKIIRVGNRMTVYWHAYRYYKKNLKGWADLAIDEVNTIPFFAKFYVDEPNLLFIHMLCRKIWFYHLPQPLSSIGYLLEPLYLQLLSNQSVITVSESTKRDLIRVGFKKQTITIISEGTHAPRLNKLPAASSKQEKPTLLSLGAMRPMKRTLDQIKAFELAKAKTPELQFWIAGDSSDRYGKKVLKAIQNSKYAKDITYHGQISPAAKWKLMRQSYCILVTSIKEGWGLVVTEAASQGTPAVVYNVDGLRDSVRDGETGLITVQNTPQHLADTIVTLLTSQARYAAIRKTAWQWSKTITFDNSYEQFREIIVA